MMLTMRQSKHDIIYIAIYFLIRALGYNAHKTYTNLILV